MKNVENTVNNILIRKADRNDLFSVIKIRKEAFTQYQASLSVCSNPDNIVRIAALTETSDEVLAQITESDVYLLYENGMPSGTARLSVPYGSAAYLSRFGIVISSQKSGCGHTLLEYIKSKAEEAGAGTLRLHTAFENHSLITFYKNHGFSIIEISDNQGYKRALMECPLNHMGIP